MSPIMVGPWRNFFTQDRLKQLEMTFLYLFILLKKSLHLVGEDFYKKRIVLKSCVKSHLKIFLIKLCRIFFFFNSLFKVDITNIVILLISNVLIQIILIQSSSTYMQKRIISAPIETLQIKHLPLSAVK